MRLPIVSYEGRFRLVWDFAVLGLSLWVSLAVPFQAAFSLSSSWDSYLLVSSLSVDLLFLLDFGLNFLTSFPSPHTGEEVCRKSLIAKRYVLSWQFGLDLVASIPWSFVDLAAPGYSGSAGIFRLVRLLRLSSLLKRMKAKENFKNTVRFLQILLLFVLLTHWTVCIFRAVVSASGDEWVTTRDLEYSKDMYAESALSVYFSFSFYSSLMVQTGGDMLPLSVSETLTVTILELTALVIGTLLYSDMLGVIGRASERSSRVNEKLDTLNIMYSYLQLPNSLVKQINLYAMKAEYSYLDVELQSKFLAGLPPSIYTEVTKWLLTEILDANASLRDLDGVNMDKLVKCLKSGMSTPEEMLFLQGQKGSRTYFLISGKVDLLVNGTAEEEILEHVKSGAHFGFCSLLTASKRYSYSACSLSYSSYSHISNEDLMAVISTERMVFEELRNEELRRHEGLRGLVQGIAAQIPYLQGLKDSVEGLFQLQTLLRTQTVSDAEMLVAKGQPNTAVYYVHSGALGLVVADTLVLEVLPAGSVFGLYSLFSSHPQPYNVRSVAKSTTVMYLEHDDLKLLASSMPGLKAARAIYKHLKRDDYVKNTM